MKRLLALLMVVVAALVLPASSSAATTYHGTFTDASGYKVATALSPDSGHFDLATGGNWSIVRESNGTGINGLLPVSGSCKAWLPPCPFSLPLTRVNWESGTWDNGSYTTEGVLPHGAVTFNMDLTFANGALALHVDITGCPFGWQYWDYTG